MFLEYDNTENNGNGLSVMAIMASPRKSGYTAKLLGSLLREFPKGTDIEIINIRLVRSNDAARHLLWLRIKHNTESLFLPRDRTFKLFHT